MELVLSLFPGIDFLGRAFEAVGFCVVRGPDLILDQYIEDFHCPDGRFDGVIGGPPCQHYSDANRNRNPEIGDRTVAEMLRVIDEARPKWFLMENVRQVPDVVVDGYTVQRLPVMDWEFGGSQRRLRHIQFGSLDGSIIRPVRTVEARSVTARAVLCRMTNPHDRESRRLNKQGFPNLNLPAFTKLARTRAIGNGVPFRMGHALATAVSLRSVATSADCPCGCGRRITGKQLMATASCRKRMERDRKQPRRRLTYHPTPK